MCFRHLLKSLNFNRKKTNIPYSPMIMLVTKTNNVLYETLYVNASL